MSQRNNVRGPTSALTEFLRDSGITPTSISARAATRHQNEGQQVAGPSTTRTIRTPTRRSTRRSTGNTGYASDNLDEPEEADAMDVDEEAKVVNSSKKQKLSKAAEARLKAKEKKKKGKKGSDDDDDDDYAYTALSKSLWASNTPRPPVGAFENCATCKKQFTVTKYTLTSSTGDGFLCHQCAKAGGNDPFKKPAVPRKRKAASNRKNVASFQERRFPTLVSLCVQVISDHINDVEALGDIGTLNLEAVSKALSKNRSLTPENAHLFYSPKNTTLTFSDATNLHSSALETLGYLNTNLVSLRLDFCGQLTDESLKIWTTALPALTRLELLGPFLVRPTAWQNFFMAHPKLEGFLITQSPRFDVDCMTSLVTYCPGIKELRLHEIGQMKDAFLDEIAKLQKGLWFLDISDPSESCSEGAMLDLMSAIGKNLTHLSLSKHGFLTDSFLTKGLRLHTGHLKSLTLCHLPELTDDGVAEFFNNWKNPPLVALDMSRNVDLASAALRAILGHSERCLESININGWKDVGNDELMLIGRCAELKKLDVGWCRAVDDFVVKGWLEGENVQGVVSGGCKRLQDLKVWGCNKVSAACSRRPGVVIQGAESHMVL